MKNFSTFIESSDEGELAHRRKAMKDIVPPGTFRGGDDVIPPGTFR
jgi:hypothetical protein